MQKIDTERADAERAWEAYRRARIFGGFEEAAKSAFLAGWERKRPKAKPASYEYKAGSSSVSMSVSKWIDANKIPIGTRFRVTFEEL